MVAAMSAAAGSAAVAGRAGHQWGRMSSSRGSSGSGLMARPGAVVRMAPDASSAATVRGGGVRVRAASIHGSTRVTAASGAGGVHAHAAVHDSRAGAAGVGLEGGMGRSAMRASRGALHAAALACGGVAPRGRVVAKAAVSSRDPARKSNSADKENFGVFNVSTEKLPGGDKLTNEGILGFIVAGFLALWLGGTAVRTFAVMIGFIFTTAKYFVMGIALVLIGVAVS